MNHLSLIKHECKRNALRRLSSQHGFELQTAGCCICMFCCDDDDDDDVALLLLKEAGRSHDCWARDCSRKRRLVARFDFWKYNLCSDEIRG